jgi:hypothetical protein
MHRRVNVFVEWLHIEVVTAFASVLARVNGSASHANHANKHVP